ncbi:hypothetical protein FKM82_030101 [Ascaphus truei]
MSLPEVALTPSPFSRRIGSSSGASDPGGAASRRRQIPGHAQVMGCPIVCVYSMLYIGVRIYSDTYVCVFYYRYEYRGGGGLTPINFCSRDPLLPAMLTFVVGAGGYPAGRERAAPNVMAAFEC